MCTNPVRKLYGNGVTTTRIGAVKDTSSHIVPSNKKPLSLVFLGV